MARNGFGIIVQIGDCLVSEDVFVEYFACDYEACKGKCCIVGDCGAPLEEDELELLERDYPAYSPLMSEAGRQAAESKGFFEIDFEGDTVTPLVPGTQECAYTLFEDGNCLCAIERCHIRGGCEFPKPVSCALYPIRIKKLSNGQLALKKDAARASASINSSVPLSSAVSAKNSTTSSLRRRILYFPSQIPSSPVTLGHDNRYIKRAKLFGNIEKLS